MVASIPSFSSFPYSFSLLPPRFCLLRLPLCDLFVCRCECHESVQPTSCSPTNILLQQYAKNLPTPKVTQAEIARRKQIEELAAKKREEQEKKREEELQESIQNNKQFLHPPFPSLFSLVFSPLLVVSLNIARYKSCNSIRKSRTW